MDPNSNTAQIQQDPYYGNDNNGGFFSSKKRIIFVALGSLLFIGIIAFIIWFVFFRGDSGPSDEEVTITYWGVWEDVEVLQPVFEEFQQQNPNITIQYEKQDIKTLGDYVDRLRTRTAEGNGPDIMRFHSSWLLQIQDILAPFPSDVVSETGLEEDYFNVVQRDLKRDGAYYGLPLSIDTLSLYINSDHLENNGSEPPETWNDLNTLARELTTIDEGRIISSGVAMGTYDNISHASDLIALLLLQNGADFDNLAGTNMESATSAFQFYTLFSGNRSTAVWDQTQDNSKIAFASGNLSMYFGYSWDIFEIEAANPDLNYQIVPVPILPDIDSEEVNTAVASYWAEGVSSRSDNQEAAFELMKFLGRNETLQTIYENQVELRGYGSPYPKRTLTNLISENDKVYPFVERADNATSTYFSSSTFDSALNEEMNVYLGNAIRSMINDNTSAQSAVETLSNGVDQVLNRYEGTNQN